MKAAFFKGGCNGNFFDSVVSWWLASAYTHCSLVIEDTWYTSSPGKGVHKHTAPEDLHEWVIVDVYNDMFESIHKAEELLGAKYDYAGLFGFVLRPAEQASSRWFCSEFVAHCLGFEEAWRFDPATLYSALTYCKK